MQRRSKLSEVAARSWRPCTAPGGPGGPVAQRRSALAGAGVAVEVFLQRPPPAAAAPRASSRCLAAAALRCNAPCCTPCRCCSTMVVCAGAVPTMATNLIGT